MFSRGKVLQSVAYRKRRQQIRKIKSALFLSLFLIVCGGLVFLLRIESIRIQTVYVEGNLSLREEDIRNAVRDQIIGNYFFIIPKNNIIFYPKLTIEKNLLEKYEEIKDVNVSFRSLTSISVSLNERKNEALWCEGEASLPGPCYLIDEEAFIFKEAFNYPNTLLVHFFGGVQGSPIGSSILPKKELEAIFSLLELLKKENLEVASVSLKEAGVREGEFRVGGKIIWNSDQNLDEVAENLKLLIENPGFKGKNDHDEISVEYINAENINKIFYKVRE